MDRLGHLAVALLLAFGAVVQQSCAQRQRVDCRTFDGGINMCRYESHREMIAKLQDLERKFPHLAQVASIGQSVQGRALAYMKISSNVTQRSPLEPMFKFVGNMHGDETLGRQLLIYMAQYLVQNYERDPRVRNLIDNTEIYLMPTMNPDGFAVSKEGCNHGLFGALRNLGRTGRNNFNNKDLNRNFPKRFEDPVFRNDAELVANREPETAQMMLWIKRNPFVLSANLHAGAVVASYPFDDSRRHPQDGFYSASPDDHFFRYVSSLYAQSHAFMHRGTACGDNFPGGITNGAHWYDVPGGMQDYNYLHSNAFEITLELTCCKHVPANTLPQEWINNKEAMLRYMEATHLGIKGFVTDENGNAVPDAEIIVEGINHSVKSYLTGEYWRLLAPGTYNVHARAPGYRPSAQIPVNIDSRQWPPRAQVVNHVLTRAVS